MRAAAEIYEFSGGVERNHRLDGLFLDQLAFEFLVRFAIKLERFGLRDQLALVGNVLRGQLAHFGLDFFEVLGSERLFAHEFVKKSVFDRRPDAEFHVGIKFEHGGGQQMRGGMPKHLHRVGIFRGEDRKLDAAVERLRKIHQLAINARDERVLGEARPNLARDLRGGGAAGHVACRTIRQRNLNVVHVFLGLKPIRANSRKFAIRTAPCFRIFRLVSRSSWPPITVARSLRDFIRLLA